MNTPTGSSSVAFQAENLQAFMISHPIPRLLRRLTPLLPTLLVLVFTAPASRAQTQFQGWCSQVKMMIEQELTLERTGFEATLTVTNNDGADAITDFSAELYFEDASVTDPNAPKDASSLFFVRPPVLENINRVDGTGVIAPTKTAVVKWFIIPTIGAGGSEPQGKRYRVGCNLGGKLQGVEIPPDNMFAIPDTITVKPEPQLRITYFQPRDVTGDDPFTPEVESPIPFTLGVLVHNHGHGPARNLKINSQQPKIMENKNGLLLVARLLGARVNDSPLNESSLLVDLGTVEPGQTAKGAWDMITSLSGHFIEFKASYTHAPELGGEATSLITDLQAHFIAREALNDDPGRDNIKDFLADVDRDPNEVPDALYETQQGNILPVNHQTQYELAGSIETNDFQVRIVSNFENWIYMRVPDPGQNRLGITRVLRSDGKVLNPANYWTNTKYTEIGNIRQDWLNIFDKVADNTPYTYSVTYAVNAVDDTPPVTRIRFAGEHSEAGDTHYITKDTQIYFMSEDESPVSIEYRIDGGTWTPALPFTIAQPGSYVIGFRARDKAGNQEEEKTARVSISGEGPSLANWVVNTRNMYLPGSAGVISVRPDNTNLEFTVAPSGVRTDGRIDVFKGVVAWPRLSGVPVSPTPANGAEITVSGQFADFYRYKINGGAWSPEFPVSRPVSLEGLSGEVTLSVLARSAYGDYLPEEQALTVSWTVNPAAPPLTAAGLPPVPTPDSPSVTLNFGGAGLSHYRWNLNNSYFRAEEPLATPLPLGPLDPGEQTLAVQVRRSGAPQAEELVPALKWLYDPAWGADFSSLPLVRTQEYEDVGGKTLTNVWDGKNNAGVPQLPGVYTVRLTLTDALGRSSYRSELVFIDKLASGQVELAGASTGPSAPHARGDWAVWQEQAEGGVSVIRARNLTSGSDAPLTVGDSPLARERPRTDGRYVVWQGRRENGVYDIFYADLGAGAVTPVAVTDTPDRQEINPVVDWPWVVYQQRAASGASAPWQLEAKNLETGAVLAVHPSTQDQLDPDIHAGRVVWQDWRDVGPGEIYFADLETGERRRVTNQTAGQYHPSIYGHVIVWQDNRHTQLEIYKFDLRKGVEERLTNTPYNETRPRLNANWLTYLEDSLGPETENLRLMDLDSGQDVPLTMAEGTHSPGALGGGFAVWAEGPEDARRVVASFLPGLQPVLSNNNTVAVTPELAARFGDAHALLAAWNASAGVTAVTKYDALDSAAPAARTATWSGGAPGGENFPLTAGEFLWVRFGEAKMLDLGDAQTAPVALSQGRNVLTYSGFPVGYTAYDFIASAGADNVNALRMLDPLAGVWRAVEIRDGAPAGPNFAIPRATALLVDMKNPVDAWKP